MKAIQPIPIKFGQNYLNRLDNINVRFNNLNNNIMSRIITYLLNVDNLSLVHSTLEEKAGCKINNQDIFCITLTDGCASVNVKAVLWNNSKFNQENAL